jgi:hypothetical protein
MSYSQPRYLQNMRDYARAGDAGVVSSNNVPSSPSYLGNAAYAYSWQAHRDVNFTQFLPLRLGRMPILLCLYGTIVVEGGLFPRTIEPENGP